jgi:hypothetical protein
MPERGADRGQTDALPEKMNCQGMTKHVASQWRQLQAAQDDPTLQDVMHGGGSERPSRRFTAKEKFPARAIWTTRPHVASQHGATLLRKGQQQSLFGFRLSDPQGSAPPINIVQRQTHHLTAAQSVACHQIEKGEITQAARNRTINGAKQCDDLLPGQCARQLLKSISPRRVDLLVKRLSQDAFGVQLPQKCAKRGDDVLQAETIVGLRGLAKKGVDLIPVQLAKGRGPLVDFQKLKEGADPTAVPQDG